MKTIKVELTGETPLLMNSPHKMLDMDTSTTKKLQKRDIKAEAEGVAYRMKNKELYVPATAIKGCLINASSYKKAGKYALKPIIAGAVRVEPEKIGLGTKTYDIDLRTVVIQGKSRIVKARPKIEKWKLSFDLVYNEKLIRPEVIKESLEDGGERIGILDFRPAKLGNFGMFKVTKWRPC